MQNTNKPLSIALVQAFANNLSASWRNGPTVRVVASPEDFPVPARADAYGMVYRGTAYIAANNHESRLDVARTLVHEAVGHFGLWKILGNAGTLRFEQDLQHAMASGNKALLQIRARVRQLYADADGRYRLTPSQESAEIAAVAAQDCLDIRSCQFKPEFGLFKSVFARLAQWLRQDMGLRIPFTLTELQGALVNSVRGLQTGGPINVNKHAHPISPSDAHFDEAAFSFAGERARTADLAALAQAQHLLNEAPDAQGSKVESEVIRQRTGWSKDVDGLWRFEISDDTARWLTPQETRQIQEQRAAKNKLTLAQGQRLEKQIDQLDTQAKLAIRMVYARFRQGEIGEDVRERELDSMHNQYSADVGALRQRLSALCELRSAEGAVHGVNPVNGLKLDEVLYHPGLFDAYPIMRSISVTVSKSTGSAGAYLLMPGQSIGSIELSADLSATPKLMVLLHELQHVVQFIEGFAPGGRVLTADTFLPDAVVQEINALSASANEVSLHAQYGLARDLRDQATQIRMQAAWLRYQRLAGEVEARNTETRQALTPAGRRANAPDATADVLPGDRIVQFGALPAVALSFAGPRSLTANKLALGQARLAVKSGKPDEAIRQNIRKLSFKNKENLLIVQKLDKKSEQLSDYKLCRQMNEKAITVFSRSGHAGDVSMKDQNSQVTHIDLMDLDAPRQ